MQDLSKIDFSKCELPEWSRWALEASNGPEPNMVSLMIRSGMRLAKKPIDGTWLQFASGTFDELRALEAICRQVDAFIESELAKPTEPEWRPCSEEFALANAEASEYRCKDVRLEDKPESWSRWYPVLEPGAGPLRFYNNLTYEFRTKAPLQQQSDHPDTRNPGRTYSARGDADSEREWFESVIRDIQTAPGDVTRVFYAVSKRPKDCGAK